MRYLPALLCILAAVAVAIACVSISVNDDDINENKGSSSEETDVNNMVNEFAWDIFDISDEDNVVFSPYSIYVALGMLLNGAEPNSLTEKELTDLLGVKDFSEANKLINTINSLLPSSSEQFTLQSSNLILVDKSVLKESGTKINKDFEKILDDYYHGTIDVADFVNDLATVKEMIRKWVADQTNDFIPNYQSVATDQTVTDILNVIYMKSDWENKFSKDANSVEKFKCADGKMVDVTLMNGSFHIKYYSDSKYRAVELPYCTYDSEGLAMYIVLPVDPDSTDIKKAWSSETKEYRETFLSNLRASKNVKVNIHLPNFEAESSFDLCEVLRSLGVTVAMSDSAEFTKILDNQVLKVGTAKHQAKIKVDESGTEAAAVTEISMVKNSVVFMPEIPVDFRCDIPFVYTISGTEDGTDLFMGYIGYL